MKKRFQNLVIGLGVLAVSFAATAGLTESGLRSALASWMKGDATVQNPWAEIVNFIAGESVIVVDTFADLATVSPTGRKTGSIVRTRGWATAGDGGAADYSYDPSSSATTNTWGVIAASGGGRYSSVVPVMLRSTFIWDPASLATNQTTSTNVTVTLAEPGDLVLVSHPNIGNQATSHLTAKASNGIVVVSFFNNSGAAIDVGVATGKLAILKY